MQRTAGLGLLASLLATQAHAQEIPFLSGIFSKVHSVTIYGQGLQLLPESDVRGRNGRCGGLDVCGAGTEVLVDATSAPRGTHLEIGLGASYLGGVASHTPGLDLRGSVRSLPTFAAYLTGLDTPLSNFVEPYAGFSFGISDLWNVRAYDPSGIPSPVKAQTFDYGGTVGGYVNSGLLDGLFVEVSYKVRRFDGVDWGRTDPPADWPKELDFSGWTVALGWQFDLKEHGHRPPEVRGLWELSRVDGQALPFVLSSTSDGAGGFDRTELLHALLNVTETRYSLTVGRRTSHLDSTGKLLLADVPQYTTYQGQIREEGGSLTLVPARSRDRKTVTRIGDDLLFELPDSSEPVLLQFKNVQ